MFFCIKGSFPDWQSDFIKTKKKNCLMPKTFVSTFVVSWRREEDGEMFR
jgi:hypothetical protein